MDWETFYLLTLILRIVIANSLHAYSCHIILSALFKRSDVHLQPIITRCLFCNFIAGLFIPTIWAYGLYFLFWTWILFAIESYIDKARAWVNAFSPVRPLRPSPYGQWEMIAITKSSNNGYVPATIGLISDVFYPVIICDCPAWNNPFWPDHISAVYNVEIRRRSSIRRTIILWKHSVLNGGQKKVHEFDYHYGWICWRDRIFNRRFPYTGPRYIDLIIRPGVCCWQSKGVIFINLKGFVRDLLCVYDTAYGKVRTYEIDGHQDSIAIYCLKRFISQTDGSLDGWRIRWLYVDREWIDENMYELCLMNKIFDLREKDISISEDCVVVGKYGWNEQLLTRPVRTESNGLGIWVINLGNRSPVIIYNVLSNSYIYYRSYIEFAPTFEPYYEDNLRLTYLNRNEAIDCFKHDTYYRKPLAPPTLKYLAAKQLLHSNPNLYRTLTAEQFRRLTGTADMNDHFDL